MLALLLALAALPPLDAASWAQLRAGETVKETRGGAGESGVSSAWTFARCAPEALWKVLTDHSRFAEFMPRLKAVEVNRRTDRGRPVPGFVRRYLAERGAQNAVEAVRDRARSH